MAFLCGVILGGIVTLIVGYVCLVVSLHRAWRG